MYGLAYPTCADAGTAYLHREEASLQPVLYSEAVDALQTLAALTLVKWVVVALYCYAFLSKIQRRIRWTHLTLPPLIHRLSLSDRVGDPSVHDLNVERNDETILRFHGIEEAVISTSLDDQHWRRNDEDICDNPEECHCKRDGVKPEAAVSSAFGTGDRSNRRDKRSVFEVVLWVSAQAELGHRHRGGERHYVRDSNGNARLPIGNLQDRQEGINRGSREAGAVWQRRALPATEPTSLLAWQNQFAIGISS